MAFPQEPTRTPTSIADISIELDDIIDDEGGNNYAARYSVQVVMSDGSLRVQRGNLVPHITTNKRNALLAFMQTLRQRAIDQIL